MEVEIEGGRVRSSGVEHIPKIHEEGVATPAEAKKGRRTWLGGVGLQPYF